MGYLTIGVDDKHDDVYYSEEEAVCDCCKDIVDITSKKNYLDVEDALYNEKIDEDLFEKLHLMNCEVICIDCFNKLKDSFVEEKQ